jgi:hypothetical protein
MLKDPEWRKLKQTDIADLAGVTDRFVRIVKADMATPKKDRNGSGSEDDQRGAEAPTVDNDQDTEIETLTSAPKDESGPGDVECSRCSGSGRVPITAKMPAALSESAEFVNAWQDYQLFRIQKRSKLTTVGISRLFKKLESWGPEKATKALEITMENGWTGVFEPDQNGRASDDPRGNMATLEAYIAQL